MEELKAKINAFLDRVNSTGIRIPMLREPKTGMASISLTMMVISYLIVIVGLVGKWSKLAEGIDIQQSMNLLILTSGLYFGRSLTYKTKDDSQVTTNNEGTKE